MKISIRVAACFFVLNAAVTTDAFAADRMLTLASGRSNDALTIIADGKVETKVELGNGTIFGIREKTIHVLSTTKIEGTIKRRLQAIDSRTGKTLSQIEINVPFQSWLGGPDEQIVVGESGQHFLISVEDLGEANGHRKKFSLAIVESSTGVTELLPLPENFNSPRVQKIPGAVAIYGWTGLGLYCYDTSSKSLACIVPDGCEDPEGTPYRESTKYGMGVKSGSEVFRWGSKGRIEWFDLKDGKLIPGKVTDLKVQPSWVVASTFKGTPAIICGIRSGKDEMSLLAYDATLDKELARVDAPLFASRAPATLSNGSGLLVNDLDGRVWRMSLADLSVREVIKLPSDVAPYPSEARVIPLTE